MKYASQWSVPREMFEDPDRVRMALQRNAENTFAQFWGELVKEHLDKPKWTYPQDEWERMLASGPRYGPTEPPAADTEWLAMRFIMYRSDELDFMRDAVVFGCRVDLEPARQERVTLYTTEDPQVADLKRAFEDEFKAHRRTRGELKCLRNQTGSFWECIKLAFRRLFKR